jgi:predicted RNA-binding Zn ribbon-like protein
VPTEHLWLLPHEPRPVRLMNTIWADRDGVHDGLASTAALGAWLEETELAGDPVDVTRGELEQARALRDALRGLAAWVSADERPTAQDGPEVDDAIDVVNRCARSASSTPLLRREGSTLEREVASTGSVVTAALSTVAVEAVELLTGELASELRPCLAPRCVLYYVRQHPRRAWCSPGCGNRARVARHYRRNRESAG